ncbi:MAG: hypothetical protein K0B10_11215 [Vicingaceae bacterium]|nr:hypothetical protein [Vicingaceae bacterium]
MKELHNHIFSNTTCISKELMMKYINKQLTKNELHEVEKHMLDCDLCTDAMAGMKYAKNSSILFALDHKIENRIASNQTNSFFKGGWLMAAASLIAVIFGAYLLINLFNENKFNKNEMAIHEQASPLPKENFLEEEAPTTVENDIELSLQKTINTQSKLEQRIGESIKEKVEKAAPTSAVEQVDYGASSEKNSLESKLDNNILMDEAGTPMEPEAVAEEVVAKNEDVNRVNDDEDRKNQVFTSTVAERKKSEKDSDKMKTRAQNKKAETKTTSNQIPAAPQQEFAVSGNTYSTQLKTNQNTYYFSGYKVVDYAVEYQNEEDFKKLAETDATPVDYLNKEEKEAAEKELEKTILKESYKSVLERGMLHFKDLAYKDALADFELILAKHPTDVNALFYGALSEYHIKNYKNALRKFDAVLKNPQTEFNQEAKWYKSLTLIELKEIKEAKKLLQEIVNEQGFYKQQAQDKLTKLN